jgi:[CysO sulfur-carrier protein]-S-L-cysteine hydrolase
VVGRQPETAGPGAPEPVAVPAALVEEMLEHALREAPDEGCGILAGDAPWIEGGAPLRFYATRNADRSPYRYRIDPEEQLRVMLQIDDADEVVWGIFHSHTHTPAEPSPTDRGLAFYPRALYLIASLMDPEPPHIRAWSLDGDEVGEVEISVR